MGQAHGVAHLPVHDRHRQDRLRFWRDRRPGADMFEQAPRPIGDRDRAQRACAWPGRRPRIDDGDGCPLPHRLLDRGCEREPGRAAAGDDDVEDGSGFGHCGRLLPAHCRTDDKSIPALGTWRHFLPRIPCFQWLAAPFPSDPRDAVARNSGRAPLGVAPTSLDDGVASSWRIFVDMNIRL